MNRRTLLASLLALPLAWLPKRGEAKPQTAVTSGVALSLLAEADEYDAREKVRQNFIRSMICEAPYVELKQIEVCDPLRQRPHWRIDGQDSRFYFVSTFDEAFSFRYENGKVLANEAWVRSKLMIGYPEQFSAPELNA